MSETGKIFTRENISSECSLETIKENAISFMNIRFENIASIIENIGDECAVDPDFVRIRFNILREYIYTLSDLQIIDEQEKKRLDALFNDLRDKYNEYRFQSHSELK